MITYANVGWTPSDVRTLAPKMTEGEALEWLENNSKHIRDRMTELGWTVIQDLLIYDGVDVKPSTDQIERTANG